MKRKLLSLLLATTMVLSAFSISAFAEEEEAAGGEAMAAAYRRLMDGCAFTDIPLLDQRSVSSETFRRYIMDCILQDESYKQALLQKLDELSSRVAVPPTDLESIRQGKVLKHLRDRHFIDADNAFLPRRMHATLRELVEKMHVMPEGGWTEGIERAKRRLAQNTKDDRGNLNGWLLKDLGEFYQRRCFTEFVNEIDWTPFDRTFGKKKGDGIVRLGAKELKEAFYNNPQTVPGGEVYIIVNLIRNHEFRK